MTPWTDRPKRLHHFPDWADEGSATEVAIATADRTTSRGAFRTMAESVAARLQEAGLKPGDRVALLAGNTPEALAAMMGASLAGIVYLPLDANAEPSYWRMVIAELGVAALITDRPVVLDDMPGLRIVPLQTAVAATALQQTKGGAIPPVPSGSAEPAYILTTSGSTGRPKGVLTSHENAHSFIDWSVRRLGIGPQDVVLGTAPIHFAWSTFHLFGALYGGARLVLAGDEAPRFPGMLLEAIEAHGVTVFSTVPTVLAAMLQVGAFETGAARSLRAITYSGEPIPPATLGRVMRALPHVQFHNFFGSTETKVILTNHVDTPPSGDAEVALGSPASFAGVSLVDEQGQEVPDGEVGRICVDGPSVMMGYVTAEGLEPAPRPFVMGDYAQKGPDGLFYYRGRRDQQVKVRGNRISLPAVDAALLACPDVEEAVTFAVGQDLVGCICAKGPLQQATLAAACRARLPASSQPHRYVVLTEFPRLSNGKVDRVRLRAIAAGEA